MKLFSASVSIGIIKTSSKNKDTLLALKDDRMLNDIHSADQVPDF